MKLLDLLNFKLEKQSWKMLIHEKKPDVRNEQIEKKTYNSGYAQNYRFLNFY